MPDDGRSISRNVAFLNIFVLANDDDDDDDDDGDGEFFCGMVNWRKALSLILNRDQFRDPYHHKSLTSHEQDLNLRKTWAQVLLNEVT